MTPAAVKTPNKPFAFDDLSERLASDSAEELRVMIQELSTHDLAVSSHGRLDMTNLTDDSTFFRHTIHPIRLWEYTRIVDVMGFEPRQKVLDCGGASSPLVFLLASKDVRVHTIDLDAGLVENTRAVCGAMGWDIEASVADMTQLPFEDASFDHVVSVSVLEHLTNDQKVAATREMARVLRPGGLLALTFDFGESRAADHYPIESVAAIREFVVEPSGLRLYGNQALAAPERFEVVKWPEAPRGRLCRLRREKRAESLPEREPYHYTVFSLFLERADIS